MLHNKGVLFRSMHFSNIIVQPSGRFALIDVSDMRHSCFGKLLPWQRARNFRHIFSYNQDRELISVLGMNEFIDVYLKETRLNAINLWLFKKLMTLYF